MGKPRPGVIVQADELGDTTNSILVCPMSSDVSDYHQLRPVVEPSAANGLRLRSQIMTDKINALRRGPRPARAADGSMARHPSGSTARCSPSSGWRADPHFDLPRPNARHAHPHLALRHRMGHHHAAQIIICKKCEETHKSKAAGFNLWLGRRRRGRADDLRRLRLDAVARGIPAADFGSDGAGRAPGCRPRRR